MNFFVWLFGIIASKNVGFPVLLGVIRIYWEFYSIFTSFCSTVILFTIYNSTSLIMLSESLIILVFIIVI